MYWTVHLEGGPRRVNHAAVVVGEKIYSFGGYCTGENYKKKRPMDVYVLNTSNLRWVALPNPSNKDPQYSCIPFRRYGHTAVAYKDKVYIWGGRNDEICCNTLFCFNTETYVWSCPTVSGRIPRAKDGHSACTIGNSMYIFGGFEDELNQFSQDVWVLNFLTMQWTYVETLGTPPSFRDFHSATAFGTNMYIFGGRGDECGPHFSQQEVYSSDVMFLDTVTGKWQTPLSLGQIPIGRRSHSAFSHQGYLYIFGGYNSLCDEHYNDLYRYNPSLCVWQFVKTMGKPPCRRRRQSCVVLADKLFVFGGTSPKYGADNFSDDRDRKLINHDDLHILEFAPSLRKLCLITVLENKLDLTHLPEDIKWDIRSMTTNNCITRPLTGAG